MKTLSIVLVLSHTAFAATLPTVNESLESILANPLVHVQLPTVLMTYEEGSSMQNINDVCLDGNALYLKAKTIRVPVESNSPKNPGTKFKTVTPVATLDYTEKICVEWRQTVFKPIRKNCIRSIDQNATIATSYDLEVRELIKKPNQRNSKLRFPGPVIFTKAFSIPLCK